MIVCPGGGYAHCVTGEEGYPIAAKLNEMGYTAFVLEYRTGFHCSAYAPMEDLAQAVRYIEEHQEELNVRPENYANSADFPLEVTWPVCSAAGNMDMKRTG